MLTFELHVDGSGNEIEIHGSAEGLESLAQAILRLAQNTREGCFNHDHLMTEAWGGHELTSEAQSDDGEVVHHVKVYCWKGSHFQP